MYHSLHWLNDKCYSDLWLRIISQQAPSTIQTLNEKWYQLNATMVNKAYDDKGDNAFDTHSGKSCRMSYLLKS